MIVPEMGHVIASWYNIPIVYISHQLSVIILPLRSYQFAQDPKVLVIVFVDNNHFIMIKLNNESCSDPDLVEFFYN